MPSFHSLEAADFLANNPWGWDSYVVLGVHREGSFFGEHTCLLGNKRVASVVATAFCELQALSRASLERIARQWPELVVEIMKLLDECASHARDQRCTCTLCALLSCHCSHACWLSCATGDVLLGCSTVDEYTSNTSPDEAERSRAIMNSQMPGLAAATLHALHRGASGKDDGCALMCVPGSHIA